MKKEEEIWRPIEGYEGYYEVSSHGRVRSLDRYDRRGRFWEGKILSPRLNGKGYLQVGLRKNGKGELVRVHQLVAKAFPEVCGTWFDGCEVDHINTVRDDNRAVNLSVCTSKENRNNPMTLAKVSKLVAQLSLTGELLAIHDSIKSASRALKVSHTHIAKCCAGIKYHKVAGYRWRYFKDYFKEQFYLKARERKA